MDDAGTALVPTTQRWRAPRLQLLFMTCLGASLPTWNRTALRIAASDNLVSDSFVGGYLFYTATLAASDEGNRKHLVSYVTSPFTLSCRTTFRAHKRISYFIGWCLQTRARAQQHLVLDG